MQTVKILFLLLFCFYYLTAQIETWTGIYYPGSIVLEHSELFTDKYTVYDSLQMINTRTQFYDMLRMKRDSLHKNIFAINQYISYSGKLPAKTVNLGFDFTGYAGEEYLSYDISGNQSFTLARKSMFSRFSLFSGFFNNSLILFGGIGEHKEEGVNYVPITVGLGMKLGNTVTFSYEYLRDFSVQKLEGEYEGFLADLYITGKDNFNKLKLDLRFFNRLDLKISVINDDLQTDKSIKSETSVWDPVGYRSKQSVVWNYEINEKFAVEGHLNENHNSVSGYMYDNGQTFGKVTGFRLNYDEVGMNINYYAGEHGYKGGFSYNNSDFYIRGHIETWPFTSIWADLYGYRTYFIASGKIEGHNLFISYSFDRQKYGIRTELIYKRLFFSAEAQTWEPVLVTIGQQNLKNYKLDLENMDGVTIRGEFYKELGDKYILSYLFSQYIPVSFSYRTGNGSNTIGSSGSGSVYGGGYHLLRLQFLF